MHGREKSDFAIVAGKPTNKAVPTASEPVERRGQPRGMRASKARTGHRTGQPCHRRRTNPIVTRVLADLDEKLAPFYSDIGRPSIDPKLMIRMLIVGYCYGMQFQ